MVVVELDASVETDRAAPDATRPAMVHIHIVDAVAVDLHACMYNAPMHLLFYFAL